MKFRAALAAGLAGLVAVACTESPTTPSASRIATSTGFASEPVYVSGNPTCTDMGFLGGVKLEPTAANASYTLTTSVGTITLTINDANTGIASWSSSYPIDGIFMKAGAGGNYYYYEGATSGGGELTVVANDNGDRRDISHVDFCWYGRFTPSVNGEASYTRDYDWQINKSASAPASITTGAPLTVSYTVAMSRSYTDRDFAISGTVTVANTGYGANGTVDGVSVDVGGFAATVSCPVSFPSALANGDSFTCSYATALPDASDRLVTATVAASGLWRNSSAASLVSFGEPTTEVDASATVSDTRVPAGLGTISAPTTFAYDLSFGPYTACVPVTIDNTASFVTSDNAETGSSSASVTVDVTGCSTDWQEMGTAFAYGTGASTFTSLNSGIKRWGWSLNFGAPGSQTYDVYVGAGQNDLTKGTNVGTVTITYTGTTVTATYNLLPGYVLAEQHLYAGSTALPMVKQGNKTVASVAPGQYTVTVSGGSIWVIAHSVIGYVQP